MRVKAQVSGKLWRKYGVCQHTWWLSTLIYLTFYGLNRCFSEVLIKEFPFFLFPTNLKNCSELCCISKYVPLGVSGGVLSVWKKFQKYSVCSLLEYSVRSPECTEYYSVCSRRSKLQNSSMYMEEFPVLEKLFHMYRTVFDILACFFNIKIFHMLSKNGHFLGYP